MNWNSRNKVDNPLKSLDLNLAIVGLFFTAMFLVTQAINAQTTSSSDCEGALPFCDPVNEGLGTVLSVGNVENEVNSSISCVDHENFSTWYRFSPTSDGTFNFVLTPNDGQDDYDWALFDMTNSSCDQIPIDGDLLISCNSWGDFGFNGQTGISTVNGGTGNSNGPGTFNGPPFNADIDVFMGNEYVLMVSNWSNSTSGFTINTSGSTAGGVFAESNLTVAPDQLICRGDTINVYSNFTGSILGNLTYDWTPASLFVDPTVQDPEASQPINESTQVKLNFSNGGCLLTRTIDVTVGKVNYNTEDLDQNVCIGEVSTLNIGFSGNLLPPGLMVTWSPGYLLDDSTRLVPTTTQLTDTTQFVFRIKNGPCEEVVDSLKVFVYSDTVSAAFDFDFNDNDQTIPIEVDFTNSSVGDDRSEWDFGDGNTSSFSTQRSPEQYPFPGYDRYVVQLVSISSSGFCSDTLEKVIEFPDVVYPNIITPNEDGINDVLWVTGLKIGTGLRLYNRWGRLVYQSDNYLHDWAANDLLDGMYFYEFTDPSNSKVTGWIEVVR